MLTVENTENSCLQMSTISNTSSNASTATNAIALITANIQFQSANSPSPLGNNVLKIGSSGENVWKKRNLENSVQIPPETQVKSKISIDKRYLNMFL